MNQDSHPSVALTADGAASNTADRINILIVDDEASNLLVLETLLDDPGYRLVRAQTADEALFALINHEFALLILDVLMPDMSGIELAKIVKSRKKTADIPIVFLTAYYDKDQHVLAGYSTGAVDYLSKPVNPAVLRSKVAVFAELARKRRAVLLSNQALLAEVEERRRIEERLRELNESLERHVVERTEALQQTDKKLRALMASITDGLMLIDRRWQCSYVNAQGAEMLGCAAGELVGADVWTALPGLVGNGFEASFRKAVDSDSATSVVERYASSAPSWLECHCYPTGDGLSVYFHDVAERREVELRRDQLLDAERAARAEGERVAQAKDEFLASLSHELRTPIAAIVGWVKVLQRPDVDADTRQRGVSAIARNADTQTRLISDLLDLGRVLSGKLQVNRDSVDLNSIASATAETLRPAAQLKSITIELDLAHDGALLVTGDAVRLQQIATNLVTNAVKFTPVKGRIAVRTSGDDDSVLLPVSDNGEGIAPEFLPHLFDRFSQADGTASRAHGGLGLGLSIVKTLVELHGGTVSAESEGKARGSTFHVRLPRATMDRPVPSVLSSVSSSNASMPPVNDDFLISLTGTSVLLVDDNADILEAGRRALEDYGATVVTAESAGAALDNLSVRVFDVLVSDLGMPQMDGYQLMREIRNARRLSVEEFPAIALTAFVRAEDHARAIDAGYQLCVQKPVNPPVLAKAILDISRNRRTKTEDSVVAAELSKSDSRDAVPLRTLLVEDSPDLRELIGSMMSEEGMSVVTCGRAEEGEVVLRGERFDAVFTDISLPGISGVDFARGIVQAYPETWVIFSSGYPVGEAASSIGPKVRSLLKPFEVDDLRRIVAEVRSSLRRQ